VSVPAWLRGHLDRKFKGPPFPPHLLYGTGEHLAELLGTVGEQETVPAEPYREVQWLPCPPMPEWVLAELETMDRQRGQEGSSTSTPLSLSSWRPFPKE
jgi:hypothetical protein